MRTIALLSIAVLLAPLAVAEEDGNERELKAAIQRVKELVKKAEELEQRGSHEDAQELRRKAGQLEERIHAARKYRKAKRGGGDELRRVMNDLEAGMRGLRKLGGHQEVLAHLKRIAIGVSEEIAQRERHKRGGDKERAAAKKQLGIMRACMHALMKAEKRDAAELMEHAIHAGELRLEGRRDEEARGIMRRAPGNAEMAELFAVSSEILADMRQSELAHAAARLAEQAKARWQRERNRERGHGEREHRERDGRARIEQVMERVERLEERLDKLSGLLERMLRERKRDR